MLTLHTQRRPKTPPALVGPDWFYRAVGLRRKPLASLISAFNEALPL
jgi:hypothetical protein